MEIIDKTLAENYKTKRTDCAWIAQYLFTDCSEGSRGGACVGWGGGGGRSRLFCFKEEKGRKEQKPTGQAIKRPPIPLSPRCGSATGLD